MATDKRYTVAGVSTLNGDTKVRFANDVMRIKVLAKNGHTDIQLVELPEAMLKTEAAKFMAARVPECGLASSDRGVLDQARQAAQGQSRSQESRQSCCD